MLRETMYGSYLIEQTKANHHLSYNASSECFDLIYHRNDFVVLCF